MATFRQIEALIALSETGSIAAAARSLGIAQSAASKHLAEFEAQFPSPLLDRSNRRAKLTVDGAEVLIRCRKVLDRRDALLDELSNKELRIRHLRLGVTEVTALTWLKALLHALNVEYPKVKIELKVEVSDQLRCQLLAGELDAVLVTDVGPSPGVWRQRVGSVENRWYCSPSIKPNRTTLRFKDLSSFNLLSQGALARSGVPLDRWLAHNGISPRSIISSSSLLALIDMIASGIGVGYLPEPLVRDSIRRRSITELRLQPKLPPVDYVLLMRSSESMRMRKRLLDLVGRVCNFTVLPSESTAYPHELVRGGGR